MLRGIIPFNTTQISELHTLLSKSNLNNSPIWSKFDSALNNPNQISGVQLSQEELEILLDEVGLEISEDIRVLINETMLKWRS